jgi:hypothetical protein
VLAAWRQGRNFVTNGPMLFLEAGDLAPGDVADYPQPGKELHVRVQAISNEPLETLELVANGEVVARARLDADQRDAVLSHTLRIGESTWVAARCSDREMLLSDEELQRYRRRPGQPKEEPCRLRFAHTSPIYLTVAGAPVRVARSVDEARRALEAFERFAKEKAGEHYRDELLRQIEVARSRLRE